MRSAGYSLVSLVTCQHSVNMFRRQALLERVVAKSGAPSVVLDVAGATPLAALSRLRAAVPVDSVARDDWRKKARLASVLGSCPRSQSSLRSGVRVVCAPLMVVCVACQACDIGSSIARLCTAEPARASHLAWKMFWAGRIPSVAWARSATI